MASPKLDVTNEEFQTSYRATYRDSENKEIEIKTEKQLKDLLVLSSRGQIEIFIRRREYVLPEQEERKTKTVKKNKASTDSYCDQENPGFLFRAGGRILRVFNCQT